MARLGIVLCAAVLLVSGCGATTRQDVTSAPATTTSSTIEKKVHDRYQGPTLQALLAKAKTDQVDAIIAIQGALLKKDPASLSAPERVVLEVEGLENEVNNGGYDQFFLNDPSYAREIVAALKRIDCPKFARITDDAEGVLGLQADWTDDQIATSAADASDAEMARLDRLDDEFYAYPEPLEDRLLAFIRAHAAEIKL